MANRLQNEYSPYLQQHANNPVDWYPWGDEAFEKAQSENKPIFLSIGYSACHWCHVMERESFENEATARILNEHFISIKVDREERPDIDKHFQEVYQLMNGRPGGWPTSIFLTQDLKPFYAGTYLPDTPKHGMMSFSSLLEVIAERYRNDHKTLSEKADEILGFLNPKNEKIEATRLDESIIERFIDQAKQLFDPQNGGFNKAPKFPQTSILSLLLDLHRLTGDKDALELATYSLTSMARGGLRDLVDGGFCRYSTDDEWLVPHFEKMSYDNALLSQLYLKAHHVTGDNFYKSVAFEAIDFMLDRMSESHLFYSASDADTEGEEGKYFVYSYDEALTVFTEVGIPEAAHNDLTNALHITKSGNFEGSNIIRVDNPKVIDIPHYDEAIEALSKLRKERTYPFIDKKVLVSWNAMMIKSLFIAGRTEPGYLDQAKASLDALTRSMYVDGQLYHATLIGKCPKITAFLEDYAYLADTFIEAYRSTLDETHLITATKLANTAIEEYFNNGLWKFSHGEFETRADIYDSSYPSALSVMLGVLQSLTILVNDEYRKFVFRTLQIHSHDVMRQPISSPLMSAAVVRYLKDDILIKAKEDALIDRIAMLDTIRYPYTSYKVDTNNGFMLCNSHSCFGDEKGFEEAVALLAERTS